MIKKVKIIIEIDSCTKCPFFKEGDSYSTDGFDRMNDWFCTKSKKEKKIQGAVEWHDKIEIPKWCPARKM